MRGKTRAFIKSVYRMWKTSSFDPVQAHPDAALVVCFLEGRLSQQESREFKRHIVLCETCAERLAVSVSLSEPGNIAVAAGLLQALKKRLSERISENILEIDLLLKDRALELLNTTGEIFPGEEIIPDAVFRAGKPVEFRGQLIVCNDFKDVRIELRIENKHNRHARVSVLLKDRPDRRPVRNDSRVTLAREGIELESYCIDSGRACFEDVAPGSYTVAISIDNKVIASVFLKMHPE
jgi:hypothetical protein